MIYTLIVILVSLICYSITFDNGVALTPPMGWMTWLRYMCEVDCEKHPDGCINEDLIVKTIDRIVEDGYLKAGYNYVNIDDCWESFERDANSRLQPNATRFPHGMKWLSDYAHSKGVYLGTYTDYGTKTCGGYPGTYGYVDIDAQTFAEWGIDNLKVDGCWCEQSEYKDGYTKLSQALNKTGRPIVYACSWPAYDINASFPYLETICNLWRPYGDISNRWTSLSKIIKQWGDQQARYAAANGPGHWVDPDMLVIGNEGPDLGIEEYKTQMALWAMFAAPLYMSTDLRTVTQEMKDILLNSEIISVDQDPMGSAGRMFFRDDFYEIWVRNLANGDYAIAVYNRDNTTTIDVEIVPQKLGILYKNGLIFRDLYLHQDIVTLKEGQALTVKQLPRHATKIYRVRYV